MIKLNERAKEICDLLLIKHYKATMIISSILVLIAFGILLYDIYLLFKVGCWYGY